MRDPGSDVGRYLGGLDGLRAVACLTVVAAHCIGHFAPTATPNGVAQILVQGMTIFFTLSGSAALRAADCCGSSRPTS